MFTRKNPGAGEKHIAYDGDCTIRPLGRKSAGNLRRVAAISGVVAVASLVFSGSANPASASENRARLIFEG